MIIRLHLLCLHGVMTIITNIISKSYSGTLPNTVNDQKLKITEQLTDKIKRSGKFWSAGFFPNTNLISNPLDQLSKQPRLRECIYIRNDFGLVTIFPVAN